MLHMETVAYSLHSTIDEFTDAIVHVLTEFCQESGFCCTLLAGGRVPSEGDKVRCFSYHIGGQSVSNNFGRSYVHFDEHCMLPFSTYVTRSLGRLIYHYEKQYLSNIVTYRGTCRSHFRQQ